MSRDEFRHLEHADLALAVKYRPEIVVRVDHGSFLFVLTTVPLDIWTGLMKAGFGLRLEGVFLVFGIKAD